MIMNDPLCLAIEHHWREHRPRMVASLEQHDRLRQAVEYAARRTSEVESNLIQQGVPPPQAMELMREEWAFLPSEADVPNLPNGGPDRWLDIQVGSDCLTVEDLDAGGRPDHSQDQTKALSREA
jgi:hypothetical protein